MQITPTCIPCLLKRVIYEAELVDPSKAPAALMAAMKVFVNEYSGNEVSAKLATKVHRAAYEAIGTMDPYKRIKDMSNQVAKDLLPKARRILEGAKDPLEAAMTIAIIGNILDFGIASRYDGPQDLMANFDKLYDEGLGHNDVGRFRHLLGPKSKVVLFCDNCGEIIFDGLLCEVLGELGVKVTMVVKGEPILTDATIEDAREYGMDAKVEVLLDTGSFAVGVDMDGLPVEVKQSLDEADLIISKGMANYESFSDLDLYPIVHLMRTKCGPVARSLGLPQERSVIAFFNDFEQEDPPFSKGG